MAEVSPFLCFIGFAAIPLLRFGGSSPVSRSGFEQKRTIKLNYQVIKNMNVWRMGHKLKEWRVLINVYFKNLPYVESLFFRNPYLKNK